MRLGGEIPAHFHLMYALTQSFQTSAGQVAAGVVGDGPPLILAHGWPWSSYSWHRVLPALAKRFRVHFFDMPGYGRSEKNPSARTGLDVQGAVFCEMIDHWGLSAPAVVAHDFGGATTLRAHLLYGRDFRSLVLMNVVALRPWGSEFFDHVGRHVDAFSGLPPHIHRAVAEAYMRGALAHPIPDEDVAMLLAPWLDAAGQVSFYRQFAQADEAFTEDFEPVLAEMRCPVHVIWGEDDPWIPVSRGEALAQMIGKAPFHRMPGLGHLPQLEAPDGVANALLSALPSTKEAV